MTASYDVLRRMQRRMCLFLMLTAVLQYCHKYSVSSATYSAAAVQSHGSLVKPAMCLRCPAMT